MHKREKGNHIFDRLLEINSVNGNRKKWFMKKRILFLISKFIRKKSKANHKSILRNKKMHEGNGIRFARHISFVEPFFRCQNESSRVSGTRTKYWKKNICSLLCGANCKERNKKNLSPKRNSFCIFIDGSKLFTFVSPPETCPYY